MKKLYVFLSLICMYAYVCAQNVVQVEYFIDTDAGVGNNTLLNITPAPDGSFPFTATVTGLPNGYHYLYIRAKDSNGKWSITGRRLFEIIPASVSKIIITGEYFFDADPGFGLAAPVTINAPGTFILENFTAVTSNLPAGYHKLYNRVRDNEGRWSQTVRRNIEIYVAPDSLITLFEYFYDEDPGVGNALRINFTSPGGSVIQSNNLPLACFDANGIYAVYTRTLDSKGSWSQTTRNVFSVKDGNTVTTTKAGLWSDPTTWSNGQIPSASTPVILNHNIIVDATATCRWLMTLCHNVTINSGFHLTITGN